MAQFTGSGALIFGGDHHRVYDCEFYGGPLILDGANYARIENCLFVRPAGNAAIGVSGFGPSGNFITITHNTIEGDVIVGQDGGASNSWCILANNHIIGNIAVHRYASVVVADNTILGDGVVDTDHVLIEECSDVAITGNSFLDDEDTNTVHIVGDYGSSRNGDIIADNNFTGCQGTINLEGTPYSAVIGNRYGPGTGGGFERSCFRIDSDDCLVEGNMIEGFYPSLVDNTIDMIEVVGDRNLVTGNKLTPNSVGGDPRYGINVTGDDNVVVGNDLRGGPFGTAPIGDSGSGTILLYPADATYGDNFT